MKISLTDGYDFWCPHCESGNEICEWDTVCDHPEVGFKEVACVHCLVPFVLRVEITLKYTTISPPKRNLSAYIETGE